MPQRTSPSIVASQNFLNQAAMAGGTTTGNTTLHIPAASGLFRVSVYVTSTAGSAGDSGTVVVNITYNDGAFGSATAFQPFGSTSGFAAAQPFTLNSIWCQAGTPIQISFTTSYSGSIGFVYNVYTVIEQLS